MKKKIELPILQSEGVNPSDAYNVLMRTSAEMLKLAVVHEVITHEQTDVFIFDFCNVRDEKEVLALQTQLSRILYREAIDYSGILFIHGAMSWGKTRELRSKIARGKEFTNRDLNDSDHMRSVMKRGEKGLETPKEVSEEVLKTMNRMERRKGRYPEKKLH